MTDVAGIAADRLKSFIDRIENLETEKRAISDDIREVKSEARGAGFDMKAINTILARRKQDASDLAEHDAIVELYLRALGDLASTPLGQSAIDRVAA